MPPKPLSEYSIHEWVPEDIRKGAIIAFVAAKNMGKSFLNLDLMYRLRDRFSSCVVVSGTAGTDKNGYADYVPAAYIHDEFDSDTLLNMFDEKKNALFALREKKKLYPSKVQYDFEKEWALVLDDVLDSPKVKNSEFLKVIATKNRHANVVVFVICNDPKDLPSKLRKAADYVILFRPPTEPFADGLMEYAPSGVTKAEFKYLLNSLTEDRSVMVIDGTMKGGNPIEAIKTYRASGIHTQKKWTIGSVNYRSFSAQYMRKEAFKTNCLALASMNGKKKEPDSKSGALRLNSRVTVMKAVKSSAPTPKPSTPKPLTTKPSASRPSPLVKPVKAKPSAAKRPRADDRVAPKRLKAICEKDERQKKARPNKTHDHHSNNQDRNTQEDDSDGDDGSGDDQDDEAGQDGETDLDCETDQEDNGNHNHDQDNQDNQDNQDDQNNDQLDTRKRKTPITRVCRMEQTPYFAF